MDGAFRFAGRARRIEPESDIVGVGGCDASERWRGVDERVQCMIDVLIRERMRNDQRAIRAARLFECGRHGGQHRTRCDHDTRAAMREHIGVVGGSEQRVDDHGHHARKQCAEKGHGQFHGVEHHEQDALLGMRAQRAQRASEAARACFEFTVSERGVVVDISGFIGARGIQCEEMRGEIELRGRGNDRCGCPCR